MRSTLSGLCKSFMENKERIRVAFAWENYYLHPVCAALFINQRQIADTDWMKRCKGILEEHTGAFSGFRGIAKLSMISYLALDGSPERRMQKALMVYDAMKEHFFSSQYLSVASMMISGMAEKDRYEEIARRTRRIYDLMRKEHPFLTSSEDSVFAALLALSEKSDEEVIRETEDCYRLLKEQFSAGNALQSLSHALALGEGTAKEKCERTIRLYDLLKEKGCKYGTSYELATLGVLALLPAKLETIAEDVAETDAFLAKQKGYGFFGFSRKQRLMHAGLIVASDYIGENVELKMGAAAVGGTIALIVAQQTAICAAVVAASAAASNSSSSS
ncbi:Uncharacterised protein [Blautia hydrogenotrophica]|uniref:DUF4003 domain-containing protein n=1 Tax=Blautia hydrogenotrophica TaxID=53443 RepID=UPI0006C19841|nr:DUF4003 domain-containing protein [Blautia hydrogenotrophica]CUM92995.1 Uncharacterised protein [Blautia hydrogenotrophica]SCH49384.1 Uncharacterised protein [uncultured Blautia sp.]